MREIKFRQALYLDGKFKQWHYWGFINKAFIGPDTGLCSPKDAKRNSFQYTGKRDKSGKEIYESDKVRGQGQWGSTTSSKVVFSCDGAQVEIGDNWIRLSQFTELEVIGNVTDNPKLLKELNNG